MSLALYIHWPFCKAKCPYCDFNSHVRENVAQDQWRAGLLSELRFYASQTLSAEFPTEQGEARSGRGKRSAGGVSPPVTSIFFGGGTPSLMPPETVAAVIAEAEKLFGFTDDVEITLEANPTSVEAERFKAYRAAGVNRLSLGIQSLNSRHLAFLGREHSADEARAAIALAAEIFPRYSFDLIYALHGQSLSEWEAELRAALTLAGDHLSLYQLTIEPGTQFYHLHQAGKLPVLSADDSAAYYELTQQIMEAAGMPAYEISNHARQGQESRHNLTYWRGGEYIGIGPGAHGRICLLGLPPQTPRYAPRLARLEVPFGDGARHATVNLRSPEKWLAQVQECGHGQESSTPLSAEEVREERILMGIRLREGLPLAVLDIPPLPMGEVAERSDTGEGDFLYSPSPGSVTSPTSPNGRGVLAALETEGLITLTSTHLIPTARGRLVLNALVEKLVSAV